MVLSTPRLVRQKKFVLVWATMRAQPSGSGGLELEDFFNSARRYRATERGENRSYTVSYWEAYGSVLRYQRHYTFLEANFALPPFAVRM